MGLIVVVEIFRHERSDCRSSPQTILWSGSEMCISKTQRKHRGFNVKTLNWEKHGREELHYIILWLQVQWFGRSVQSSDSQSCLLRWRRGLFILHWAVGLEVDDCGSDLHVSHVVTAAISDADLLGLHIEESDTIHNCSCWEALHVMNVKEDRAA